MSVELTLSQLLDVVSRLVNIGIAGDSGTLSAILLQYQYHRYFYKKK